jgi:hypothetical protein
MSNTSGSSYIGIDDTNRFSIGYDDTTKYWNFDSSGTIILPVGGDIKNSSGNSIICNIPGPTSSVPATMTSTGIAGQLAYNSSHVYVCVATNTWRRASLGTF